MIDQQDAFLRARKRRIVFLEGMKSLRRMTPGMVHMYNMTSMSRVEVAVSRNELQEMLAIT